MKSAACLALLGAFVVAVHWPAERADFSLDDYDYIAGNPSIRSVAEALSAFARPFPPQLPEKAIYRPLTNLTYAIDFSFWRDDARGYHETNVALYVLVVWLVFALAIGYDRSLPFAFAVALGFAAHPVHCRSRRQHHGPQRGPVAGLRARVAGPQLVSFPRSVADHPGYVNYDALRAQPDQLATDARIVGTLCENALARGDRAFVVLVPGDIHLVLHDELQRLFGSPEVIPGTFSQAGTGAPVRLLRFQRRVADP